MHVDVFNPKVSVVRQHPHGNVIKLTDSSSGVLTIFTNADWSDWDQLVRAVESFRENQEA